VADMLTVGREHYQVHISKGLPLNESVAEFLTKDEIQKVKKSEGKWIVAGIEQINNNVIDYEQVISEGLESISYNIEKNIYNEIKDAANSMEELGEGDAEGRHI
jgi:hypothetical protein